MIPSCGQSIDQVILEKHQHFTGKFKSRALMSVYTVMEMDNILT
jgi:hypothetical protein